MFCKNCGAENESDAKFCVYCGQALKTAEPNFSYNSTNNESNKVVIVNNSNSSKQAADIVAKVFMVLACVGGAFALLIPLIWMVPMTIHAWNSIDNNKPMGVGFKVCTLLFVSLIAGICLLIRDEIKD